MKKTVSDDDSDDEGLASDEDMTKITTQFLKDELLHYDSYVKMAQPVTYNKREEKGILMVRSSQQLLHALVGE